MGNFTFIRFEYAPGKHTKQNNPTDLPLDLNLNSYFNLTNLMPFQTYLYLFNCIAFRLKIADMMVTDFSKFHCISFNFDDYIPFLQEFVESFVVLWRVGLHKVE